jgi:lipid-binding SYLF domain-containing protein
MRRSCNVIMLVLFFTATTLGQEKEVQRLKECGTVMSEILNIPDGIPKDLLDKAECVVVFPAVKKVAIGIGGSYGRGALICRGGANYAGPWGTPAMYALEGGNIGFQLGGQATDFVLLIMNPKGAKSILGSKVKLGGDAAAAAGPKGRTVSAAPQMW